MTAIQQDHYKEFKYWLGVLIPSCSILFATFRFGGYVSDLKQRMSKWDSYQTDIARTDSTIKYHEEADNRIHIYLMQEIDSLKNIIIAQWNI